MTPLLLLFLFLAVLGAAARWGPDTRESGEWRWGDAPAAAPSPRAPGRGGVAGHR